jgi:hypothetical protein
MNSLLGQTWIEAGVDLGFKVTAPFTLRTSAGQSFVYDAFVHEFGSNQGMLLMEQWSTEKGKAAGDHGYGYSCMDAGPYERESTIEVLRDWGWSSSGKAPAWL